MSVTIATHNGSKVSREHNVRNRKITDKEKHIRKDGVYEVWHDEKIRAAYKRLFGAAVDEYNKKQKREERKIKNYFAEVCKDAQKHPCYEMIVGVYGADCNEATKKEILREFFSTWGERNPNLVLIGAYYHFDEEGEDPHIHVDYIPVAHGYKNGMHTQTALNRALYEQDGFQTEKRNNTAQIKWERRENAYLESLCVARGLTVAHPMIEEAEHLETDVYKAKKALETMQKQAQELLPVRAEYEARKEYIREMEKDFNKTNGVKENKTITGKIKSYDVPKTIWETQTVSIMDREAQKKAQARWERLVKNYPEVLSDNAHLRASNRNFAEVNASMADEIRKVNEALEKMTPEAREEFFSYFRSVEPEAAPEAQNFALEGDEIER